MTTRTTASGTVICCDAYYGLGTSARLHLTGIVPGSNCMARMLSARGLLWDDGSGAGQQISNSPQVTMPAVNGGTVGAWTSSASFPVLLAATGSDPHNFKFVYAPTSGSYRLESLNGNFLFVDATTIPGVSAVASQSTTVRDVRPFGFYAPDETIGSPAWELRRMAIYDKGVIFGIINGDGNPHMRCLNPAADVLNYPGTVWAKKFQFETMEMVDSAGDPISGGLEVIDPSTVADGVPVVYSPSQKKFYKEAAHSREFISNDSNVALTLNTGYQAWAGHLTFSSQAIKYKSVKLDALLVFSTQEQLLLGLFKDGSLIQTFNFDVSSQPNNSFNVSFLDLNVTPGNHVYEFRGKVSSGTNATTMFFSSGTLQTLPD